MTRGGDLEVELFARRRRRPTVSENGMVMPGMPASPKNSAYSDQPNAASMPSEMRVSIVAAPWRRLAQAARWNGQAPQTTTGAARVSDSHCQFVNCSAGTIAMSTTGMVSARETSSRWRHDASSSGRRSPLVLGRRGRGHMRRAVADRLDGRHEVVGADTTGVIVDRGLLGGVVHRGRHAVEPVELLLDARRARGAGHALQRQVDMDRRAGGRAHGWTPGLPTAS